MQEFGLTSKFKESKVEQEVSASYKADKYALKASINPAGKVGHAGSCGMQAVMTQHWFHASQCVCVPGPPTAWHAPKTC